MSQASNQPFPPFDPAAAHQQRPKLRPVRLFPAQAGGQTVLGLSDARQISDKVAFVAPAVQMVLPQLDGTKSVDEIVRAVGHGLTPEVLQMLVAQLDDAGLLFGPTFERMREKMRSDFDSMPNLPPASTAALADQFVMQSVGQDASEEQKAAIGPKLLRDALDHWMSEALKEAQNPSFDALPRAIVAPHLDYPRGWINYGAIWGRMRVVDRPDRVIILGTNHFGESTGICACDKGYQSPLGICEVDEEFVKTFKKNLGDKDAELAFAHRFDHEREHSIELQIPWIQHCLGADDWGRYCRVFGVLVHDPAVNNGESYDGLGLGLEPFLSAMIKTIAELGGKTLIVSSADLSHVGPAFGDAQALAGDSTEVEEARNKVFRHDREMLEMYAGGKLEELIAAFAWQQNPTRWCSLGNMVAAQRLAGAMKTDAAPGATLLNYSAAMDEQGQGMVSSAAIVMS